MTTSLIMYALAKWENGNWEIDWTAPLSPTVRARADVVARLNAETADHYAQIAVEITVLPTALPVVP